MPKDAYRGPLERVSECLWRISKSYKIGMRVDGHIVAEILPDYIYLLPFS